MMVRKGPSRRRTQDHGEAREWAQLGVAAAILAVVLYCGVAMSVFGWRHPWMTDTERFIYTWRALTWQTVDYAEARPREAGK